MKVLLLMIPFCMNSIFISHMVQMKGLKNWNLKPQDYLYIPHGSDERQRQRADSRVLKRPLYPTWFRWKFMQAISRQGLSMLYIPHGSDESICIWWSKRLNFILYIPHGSDESIADSVAWASILFALYPTWFRWKKTEKDGKALWEKIFISHMVQMKVGMAVIFFWSFFSLYIPHGSDESIIMISLVVSDFCFISHMVQMKADKEYYYRVLRLLYIPHGSDESRSINISYQLLISFISHMVQMKGHYRLQCLQ